MEKRRIQKIADLSSERLFHCPKDEVATEPEPMKKAPVKSYVSPIPFPQRLRKHNIDKQFSQFIDIFKKLHINIPFADALAQMPKYTKFIKDILRNKKKLEDHETMVLNEECNTILLNKLLPTLKDPRSYFIPCKIKIVNLKKLYVILE